MSAQHLGDIAPEDALRRSERDLLILSALAIWIGAYAILNHPWITPPVEHQLERSIRRVVTCAAGFTLCLAMTPSLWRACSRPLPTRIAMAAGAWLVAHLAHFFVRLGVFHLYRPMWGPADAEVLVAGLSGGAGMFALWTALCLIVFGERQAEARAGARSPPAEPADKARDVSAVWCDRGPWRVKVPLDEVVLFAAERDYVRLHTLSRQYLVRGRLKDWTETLPADRYMHVHRSAIVRLDAVDAIRSTGSAWRVRMRNGVEAPVSRPNGKLVRQWLKARAASPAGARP